MNKLYLTDKQLSIVQFALDFYSRVGIGQFGVIKDHPTFQEHLHREFAYKKGKLEIGDRTTRGEVVEIDKKGKWVKTKGIWNGTEEVKIWTDIENIHHSTDYSRYHEVRNNVDELFVSPRNLLTNDFSIGRNGSWGIHNENVHDDCRIAFDMVQVIRHESWKKNPNRSSVTVDSSIHFSHRKDGSSNEIKCELEC